MSWPTRSIADEAPRPGMPGRHALPRLVRPTVQRVVPCLECECPEPRRDMTGGALALLMSRELHHPDVAVVLRHREKQAPPVRVELHAKWSRDRVGGKGEHQARTAARNWNAPVR